MYVKHFCILSNVLNYVYMYVNVKNFYNCLPDDIAVIIQAFIKAGFPISTICK